MAPSPGDVYRRQIEKELQAGNATENTHDPALKTVIRSLASGVTATNDPNHRDWAAAGSLLRASHETGQERLTRLEARRLASA